MNALVLTDIGKLNILEVPDPVIDSPDMVLIRVAAVGICGSDLHGYTGRTGRRKPPLIMGHEAAGVIVEVGDEVTNVRPGDRVAIQPLIAAIGGRRLLGMDEPGAYAEFVRCPARNVRLIPESMTLTEAAMAEPVAVAVRAVNRVEVRSGAPALVVGAGPIGLLVAQLAAGRGWNPVIVSDLVDARRDVAAQFGFVPVDSADQDAWQSVLADHTGSHGVDVAFEAVGVSAAVAQAHSALKRGGDAVWIGNNAKHIEVDMQEVVTRELTIHGTYGLTDEDFETALELLASGKVNVAPLIGRYAELIEGPAVFDELLSTPEIIKGMFVFESGG